MSADNTASFADLLRRYRRQRQLTQEELAERAGVSADTISLLERGLTRAPQKATVQTLAGALELSAEELASFIAATRAARVGAATTVADDGGAVLSPQTSAQVSARIRDGSLPVPLTSILGRERDLATFLALLARPTTRLLTLTGPAGVGKTRLALELGAVLRRERSREVAVVDLIPVHEASGVLPAIARTLGIQESGGLTLLDALIVTLRERRLVLMLDNFEQVLPAARNVLELLLACPAVQAVVTSRAPLNVRGEQCYPVPPLALPDPSRTLTLDELRNVPSVALFLERAAVGEPGGAPLTLEDVRLVAGICARLDGLPLAIELAAARIRHLGLRQLFVRLHEPQFLGVLAQGPQDLAGHQRTMRSTVAWSYGLLSPDDQRVFRALGVFAGGATVEGIQMVAARDAETVLAGLASLVDANLVRRVEQPKGDSGSRYDLFVIVRAFALEQLRERGELDDAQRRLADYIQGMIEQISLTAAHAQNAELDRLLREHDNLRTVLEWVLECGELLRGQRMAARLRGFWEQRGLVVEGAEWLERLLARAEEPLTPEELEALTEAWKVLVVMQFRLCQFRRAAETGEHVLALTRRQGNPGKVARALHFVANPLAQLGELDRAEAMLSEALAIHRAEGDTFSEMIDLINRGELRTFQGRYDEALAIEQDALAISRALAAQEPSTPLILANLGETYIMMDRPAEAREVLLESQCTYDAYGQPATLARLGLGRAAWRLGAHAEALAHLERAVHLSRGQDDVAALVQELCVAAGVALDLNDLASASRTLEDASTAQARVSDPRVRWRVVERAAGYACRRGLHEPAVRLYAAAERGRAQICDLVDPAERELRARDLDTLRAALGESAWASCVAAGQTLSLNDALALARRALRQPGEQWNGTSPR
jgi:predicted ATPase/transcriptional regulator with XRE-family HTH domain